MNICWTKDDKALIVHLEAMFDTLAVMHRLSLADHELTQTLG